jgi:transketolase
MSGWLEVEFVVDSRGLPWVLEINPRICGTMRLAAMCAEVALFDIPAMRGLDGSLPAVRTGAEVPWHGAPIADPAQRIFATSRITIAARDSSCLRAKLDSLGIDLDAYTQVGPAREGRRRLRRAIMAMFDGTHEADPSSSLSAADILAVLFNRLLRYEAVGPSDRDRVFISDGPAAPALYAALMLDGILPSDSPACLPLLSRILRDLPDQHFTVGVEGPSASATQTVSVAAGTAAALWERGRRSRVYALLAAAECDPSEVWEAASSAAGGGLANLTVVVDAHVVNDSLDGTPGVRPADIASRWRAVGWDASIVNRHDMEALEAALRGAPSSKPHAVIAQTEKEIECQLR